MGIIPRMMNKIFDSIMEADEKIEFTVKVTFLEIYLEKLKDLLDSILRLFLVIFHRNKNKSQDKGTPKERYLYLTN